MAANTHQPYQKIVLVPRGDAIESSFLLVASGPTITSISLSQGAIMSQWPPPTTGDEVDPPSW
jgi:hypothetical protein